MASLKRKPKNLFLDPVAVARGERYSRLHGTSLSRLVDDFLLALPAGTDDEPLSPVVKRLRGVARGGKVGRPAYRDHLHRKYGER